MEAEFTEAVVSWNDFYVTLAGVAATLVGLLFVGLALNPTVLRGEHPSGTRVWALQTFNCFLTVLVISLVTLRPEPSPLGIAALLGIFGAVGIWQVVRDFRLTRQDPDPFWRGGATLLRFGSPAVGYLVLLWAGVLALQADSAALELAFLAMFFLLVSAVINCWDLLKAIGEASGEDPPMNRWRSASGRTDDSGTAAGAEHRPPESLPRD